MQPCSVLQLQLHAYCLQLVEYGCKIGSLFQLQCKLFAMFSEVTVYLVVILPGIEFGDRNVSPEVLSQLQMRGIWLSF